MIYLTFVRAKKFLKIYLIKYAKLQFSKVTTILSLDTHLYSVKCDCNGFAVVTVVNLIKKWTLKSDVKAHDNYKQ